MQVHIAADAEIRYGQASSSNAFMPSTAPTSIATGGSCGLAVAPDSSICVAGPSKALTTIRPCCVSPQNWERGIVPRTGSPLSGFNRL